MRKIIITIMLIILTACIAYAEWINGYYRRDGTYVAPYYRSERNSSTWDNYSTKGNVNPYTGEKGSIDTERNDWDCIKKNRENYLR